jgi:hypothetical protein
MLELSAVLPFLNTAQHSDMADMATEGWHTVDDGRKLYTKTWKVPELHPGHSQPH